MKIPPAISFGEICYLQEVKEMNKGEPVFFDKQTPCDVLEEGSCMYKCGAVPFRWVQTFKGLRTRWVFCWKEGKLLISSLGSLICLFYQKKPCKHLVRCWETCENHFSLLIWTFQVDCDADHPFDTGLCQLADRLPFHKSESGPAVWLPRRVHLHLERGGSTQKRQESQWRNVNGWIET